jgi:phosphoserine phosphatase
MTHVATLIGLNALKELKRMRAVFSDAGEPTQLGPEAADLPFTPIDGMNQRATADTLRSALGASFDIVLQPAANRRKKLFLADMDSTMIQQECIDELADYVGLKARVAAITGRAMRGEIAFEPALRQRVALLKGLPLATIDKVIEKRITLTPGARSLVATMRAHGAYTCMVSGGFTLFTDRIAAMIGFDETRANMLMVDNIDTLVVGDGANDIDMIAAAGLGVAYHAKPAVAAVAYARIDHADLSALLYAQGYRSEEFVEG